VIEIKWDPYVNKIHQLENQVIKLQETISHYEKKFKSIDNLLNKKPYFGETNNFIQNGDHQLRVIVDISHLKLKNPPFLDTLLVGTRNTCNTMGVNCVENLTNKGFQINLYHTTTVDAVGAVNDGRKLLYCIVSQDTVLDP
jgi:hypothetical protein